MSWVDAHKASEEFAIAAHDALGRGSRDEARALFAQSATLEEQAFSQLDPSAKPRTFAITAVSAAALWFKSGELSMAEQIAYRALAHTNLQAFAVHELQTLLQTVWNVRAQQTAGPTFIPGQVQVSVRGGEVVTGGAPLDLIVEKVQAIQRMFYRTAEMLRHLPLRKRGPPKKEIRDTCRPWLFQGVPASYQFVVVVQSPHQVDWIGSPSDPQLLAKTFLSILKNAVEDPEEGLSRVVPQQDYRKAFLTIARDLVPNGKVSEQMEVRVAGEESCAVLVPESKAIIAQAMRMHTPPDTEDRTAVPIRGILRAVHLDKDWIEIATGNEVTIRVEDLSDTLDDEIGPMVNHQVIVSTIRDSQGKYEFRDIERDESADTTHTIADHES